MDESKLAKIVEMYGRPIELTMHRNGAFITLSQDELFKFMDLAIAVEREECAKICETKKPVSIDKYPDHWKCYEDAWRMREIVAVECAETIRNKS